MNDDDAFKHVPRQYPRRRTMVSAKLFHGPHLHELTCTITDQSQVGARVRLPAGMFVPAEVWLLDVRAGLVSHATVAWRDYPLVGLSFITTDAADRDDTAERRIFKRAWLISRT